MEHSHTRPIPPALFRNGVSRRDLSEARRYNPCGTYPTAPPRWLDVGEFRLETEENQPSSGTPYYILVVQDKITNTNIVNTTVPHRFPHRRIEEATILAGILMKELEYYRELEFNWNSNEGLPIDNEIINYVILLVSNIFCTSSEIDIGQLTVYSMPQADGGVSLYFNIDQNRIHSIFSPDRKSDRILRIENYNSPLLRKFKKSEFSLDNLKSEISWLIRKSTEITAI